MVQRQRKNRTLDGPRAVRRSVSFPQDIADAMDEEVKSDPSNNFSRLVVTAVMEWLNRHRDEEAA